MSISEKSALGVKTNVSTKNGMIQPGSFRVIAGPCTIESYEQYAC
jgi:3-deoxy-D-arabino-heptulosonate 7-phosphate (DAHP) synthase